MGVMWRGYINIILMYHGNGCCVWPGTFSLPSTVRPRLVNGVLVEAMVRGIRVHENEVEVFQWTLCNVEKAMATHSSTLAWKIPWMDEPGRLQSIGSWSSLQLCPTLCNPMDCNLPGSSVHGILQAKILEWVAMSSSRGSSQPWDQTLVSYVSCVGRLVLYH